MKHFKQAEFWFLTGSQHLYGEETLKQVANNSSGIIDFLNDGHLPARLVFKPVLTSPGSITNICREANASRNCAGLVCWMHTFSPAKMWINGLKELRKPLLHLHTQFNRDIPWNEIDMDFMNLNQSAHGDREFGFICSRLRISRKVVTGYWKDERLISSIGTWMRAAVAWQEMQDLRIARFGDNMREVAVTEGDKVAAQLGFGYSVNGFGVGDLVARINKVADSEIDRLVDEYIQNYIVGEPVKKAKSLRDAAQIEAGITAFLEEGGFGAFTTTFEDLHGLPQLPGLAVQRLMEKGYGFGAEGDWKTAALVRAMKVMAEGLKGGTSFMEDYTYHLEPGNMMVLGAHMLEVCPSISFSKPSLEVHPLGIGGKNDPARLVFGVNPGKGLNASIMDMGNRFRLVVNGVDVKETRPLPKLPVARVLWAPLPDLPTAATAWIYAGGAHHTGFSMALNAEHMEDFARIAGMEYLYIGEKTNLSDFNREIQLNELYFNMNRDFKY